MSLHHSMFIDIIAFAGEDFLFQFCLWFGDYCLNPQVNRFS